MQVVELELEWREQISFTLTQNFALKRIQFLDVLQEEAEQGDYGLTEKDVRND